MTDLINPFTRFKMSQGWTAGSHARNPAMDYATPVGFQFGSPAAGVYRRLPSNLSRTDPTAAGHMGELLIVGGRWDRHRIRFAHLEQHLAANGQKVDQETVLAATGNTGYVFPKPTPAHPEFGAHVHTYGLTPAGARWNWTLYADDIAAAPASEDSEAFPEPVEVKKEEVVEMKIIGDGTGSQKFADEFGADDIGMYFFVPNGPDATPSWVDNIRASWLLAGEPVQGRPGTWDMELARHIANARWAQKRSEIVADVTTALKPLFSEIASAVAGISPERFEALIEQGLEGVTVTVPPLSEGDAAAIAKAAADEADRRERVRLGVEPYLG